MTTSVFKKKIVYFMGGRNFDLRQATSKCFALYTEEGVWSYTDEIAQMETARMILHARFSREKLPSLRAGTELKNYHR